jgi:indolepyruvate ferredoxin oxidoreductase
LRGTAFDLFGRTQERRMERQLVRDYQAVIDELGAGLNPQNRAIAEEIAALPAQIRGFGHIKERHLAKAKAREAVLLAAFRHDTPVQSAAE